MEEHVVGCADLGCRCRGVVSVRGLREFRGWVVGWVKDGLRGGAIGEVVDD